MLPHGAGRRGQFQTTSWSLVIAAGQNRTEPAEAALARLCQTYWYPVYAFIRRRGYSPDDAGDLTQEFFLRVLEHNYLEAANPARGRFRSFLLSAVRHFLSNEWNREHAQKRGGGAVIALEMASAESRYSLEPVDSEDPERLYERQWGLALLNQALSALRQEYERDGKLEQYARLVPLLAGGDEVSYSELARQWNSTEGAVRVAVHRARQKYRGLLRQIIVETLADKEEIEDEIRFLLSALETRK